MRQVLTVMPVAVVPKPQWSNFFPDYAIVLCTKSVFQIFSLGAFRKLINACDAVFKSTIYPIWRLFWKPFYKIKVLLQLLGQAVF